MTVNRRVVEITQIRNLKNHNKKCQKEILF